MIFYIKFNKINDVEIWLEPILTTDEELSGPTRKGSIFCLGVKKKMTNSEFLSHVDVHMNM